MEMYKDQLFRKREIGEREWGTEMGNGELGTENL